MVVAEAEVVFDNEEEKTKKINRKKTVKVKYEWLNNSACFANAKNIVLNLESKLVDDNTQSKTIINEQVNQPSETSDAKQ